VNILAQMLEKNPKAALEYNSIIQEKEQLILDKTKYIDCLLEQITLLKKDKFGSSSEKYNAPVEQQQLFTEPSTEVAEAVASATSVDGSVPEASPEEEAKPRNRSGGKTKIPAEVPREEVIIDVSESEKICACGKQMEEIEPRVSEQIEVIPQQIKAIKTICKQYRCSCCSEPNRVACAPQLMVPGSIAGHSLLAYILISKF